MHIVDALRPVWNIRRRQFWVHPLRPVRMAELQMMHVGYADAYGLNLALWNQLATAFPGNLHPAQSDQPGFRPRSKITYL
jgi:hypothetical protein